MKKVIFLGMMFLMALTVQAQKRCVVLDFQVGSNVTEEETDGISYIFRSNFQPEGYTKLEQVLVTRTIRDFGYSRTEMTQQEMIKIGRNLDANIVVVGILNKFMDEYSVDIRVIDVAMGNTLVNESANFMKDSYRDSMEKTANNLAKKLSGDAGGKAISSSKKTVSPGYTDLGLPSGTIWKNFNATGFYGYDEAVSQFGNRLPSKAQWEELKAECQWSWTGSGYKVTGPNGNSIVLPADGFRSCDGGVYGVGTSGNYWSSSPYTSGSAWGLDFYPGNDLRISSPVLCNGYSVRLVQD